MRFQPASRSLRYLLASLLAMALVLGQLGALRHVLSHLQQPSHEVELQWDASAASGTHASDADEHSPCLLCAAFLALGAALPTLLLWRAERERRWHFPLFARELARPVFPVALHARGPPHHL